MSWNPALDPDWPIGDDVDSIETVIIPRARDLGDFEVRRALPAPERQMVGPFIFFDQAGPAEFVTGHSIDIRPHPHIGLSTVTYLFEGRMHHRDSLGTDAWIEPGEVNLMRSGHGITHSERTDGDMLLPSPLAARHMCLGTLNRTMASQMLLCASVLGWSLLLRVSEFTSKSSVNFNVDQELSRADISFHGASFLTAPRPLSTVKVCLHLSANCHKAAECREYSRVQFLDMG